MLRPPVQRDLRPGNDSYRTPTIEDVESESTSAGFPFPTQKIPLTSSPQGVNPAAVLRSRLDAAQQNEVMKHTNGVNGSQLPPSLDVEQSDVNLGWKHRIKHLTWAYFTLIMATGGLANVIYTVPFRFTGLDTIGMVLFLINILFYIVIWVLLGLRFYHFPYTFKASFLHPTESLFVTASIVGFGTILINISQYGPSYNGPWLDRALQVLFWFQVALSVVSTASVYLLLWSTQLFTIAQMTPIWIFPAYPLLIMGPHAAVLSSFFPQENAWRFILTGTTAQGVGFLVSMTVYSAYIYRLMTQKLPEEALRPGMFVSVGPSAFTVVGLLGMAENVPRAVPSGFMGDQVLSATVIRVLAYFACLWLWGLAIFFFLISVLAHGTTVGRGRMVFSLAWYSFVFPNTALVVATFAIGRAFESDAVKILGCVMTVLLFLTYLFVFSMMIRAIVLRQILWPQKGEDKDEGGFRIRELHPSASPLEFD